MKKIISILVIFFVLFGAFYLFNKKNKNINQKEQITFWSIQLKPFYTDKMNAIIAEFEQKHPNYKVQWIDIPIKEAQKRTLASILSSTPPDLINLNPEYSILLAKKNTLEFLDDRDLSQFHPELIEKLKYDGRVYALPYYATSSVTIYNKEIINKCLNKFSIKTFDDLFLNSNKLYKCSNIPTYAASINEGDTLAKILNKYGISKFEQKKEAQNTFYIFDNFNKMYKNNELPKDITTLSHREVIEKYMAGQANIIVAGTNFINHIKKSAPDMYEKTEISNQLTGNDGAYDISLMNLIIPKRAKNKDLAFEFALLLTNEKNQSEFARISNVLPANKYSLNDEYFKNCSDDLYDKSRCISAKQLNNLSKADFSEKYKKQINEKLNKTLEGILLNENITQKEIEKKVDEIIKIVKDYEKD